MKLKPQGANQTELELTDGTTVLFSYQTPVACYIPGEGCYRTEVNHSRTTQKHITQFLRRQDGSGAEFREERPQAFFDELTGGGK